MNKANFAIKNWKRIFLALAIVIISSGSLVMFVVKKQSDVYKDNSFEELFLETDNPYELGQHYFNQDGNSEEEYDINKARYYYSKAVQKDPIDNSYAWYQLGRANFVDGKLFAALNNFNKQIEYFGNEVPNVYYMLGLTYGHMALKSKSEADWKKAEDSFHTFLIYAPTSPWPRVDLAWVYFSQGRYAEMIPNLEEGLKYNPNHAWLLNAYGLALLNIGEKERANKQFLMAREAAAALTLEEWSQSYSENNPEEWEAGLEEFRRVIGANITLSE